MIYLGECEEVVVDTKLDLTCKGSGERYTQGNEKTSHIDACYRQNMPEVQLLHEAASAS